MRLNEDDEAVNSANWCRVKTTTFGADVITHLRSKHLFLRLLIYDVVVFVGGDDDGKATRVVSLSPSTSELASSNSSILSTKSTWKSPQNCRTKTASRQTAASMTESRRSLSTAAQTRKTHKFVGKGETQLAQNMKCLPTGNPPTTSY